MDNIDYFIKVAVTFIVKKLFECNKHILTRCILCSRPSRKFGTFCFNLKNKRRRVFFL